MQQGTIARLMSDKGFGFIKIEGNDKDLFFHANELQNVQFNDLKQGDTLEFEVQEGQKGPQAVNVSRV
jgi:cold shock protein